MPSTEYNRRHYGIVADARPEPRLTTPQNLARRTGAAVGIYETPSMPVRVQPAKKTPMEKGEPTISLVSPPVSPNMTIGVPWKKRKASGVKVIHDSDFYITI